MPKLDLSIIVISFNTKEITLNCLKTIVKSTKILSCEIIVVDNGSTDGSIQAIKAFSADHSNIRLIENKQNLGFGKANNQGVKLAKSEYILFLNSDIVVLDSAVERLFNFYKNSGKKINFLGGKLLNKDLSPQSSCGPEYSLPMIFAHLFLRGDYWGLTRSSPDKLQEVDWVSGACIMTKKEYFNQIKGFDENIFMYMDEIDLLYRAKKGGMTVYFYPEARFIHLGSASSNKRTYPIIQVFSGLKYFYSKHRTKSAQFILKTMLQLKALIGLSIGYAFNNSYLKETYGKAYQVAQMD